MRAYVTYNDVLYYCFFAPCYHGNFTQLDGLDCLGGSVPCFSCYEYNV